MKHFSCFLFLFALAGACTPPEEQELSSSDASAYVTDSTPSKWSSKSVFPLNLQISNDFSTDEITAINDASSAWSGSVSNTQFFNTTNTNISPKGSMSQYEDSLMGVYKVYSWPSGLPGGALAVTQITGLQKSNYILIEHADILLNYDYFSFTTDGSWGYDLQTVVLHEMGHFLGLYHEYSSLDESVMYPTISRYHDNKTPKSNDATKLSAKYGLGSSGMNMAMNHPSSNKEEEAGVPVVIQLELYPNNKEIMKINGVIQNRKLH